MTRSLADLFEQMDGLDANEVALLVVLYQFANAGGTCFPSHDAIATKLKRSRRWVLTGLKQLEITGRIKITTRISKSGQTSNVYSLRDVQNLHSADSLGVQNLHSAETAGFDLPNGQTPDAARCAKFAYEPTEEKKESKNTHTGAGRVVNIPLPIPQGWCPSGAVVQRAIQMFPDVTDQELADHTAKITMRCRAKGYPYADFSEAWLEWLVRDRKEAKEKTNARPSGQFETKFERDRRSQQQLREHNERAAAELLANWNRRHGVS
jgi:hypothetical protein